MAVSSLQPSGTIENTGVVMLSAKELLVNQLNAAAQNLGNSDTTGFKGIMQNGLEAAYKHPPSVQGAYVSYVQSAPIKRNVTQGALKQTQNPLHIALSGLGYFSVMVDGVRQLTRDGRLRLNEAGILVSMDGHPVLGENGDVDLSPFTRFSISNEGQITGFDANGIQTHMGRLQLCTVNDEQNDVTYVGVGRFLLAGEELPLPPNTQLLQGFLEQANISPITESVRLMRLMNLYQESQRVTEMDDSTKSKMIQLHP